MSRGSGVVGAVLLGWSVLLPWAARGSGSSIAARRLGDLVLSGTVDAWVPPWLGVLVYLVPAGGALLLVGCGLGGRIGLLASALGLLCAGSVIVGALGAIPARNLLDVGTGARLAYGGLLAGAVSTAATACALAARPRP